MINILTQFYIEKTYSCLVASYVFKKDGQKEEIIETLQNSKQDARNVKLQKYLKI